MSHNLFIKYERGTEMKRDYYYDYSQRPNVHKGMYTRRRRVFSVDRQNKSRRVHKSIEKPYRAFILV